MPQINIFELIRIQTDNVPNLKATAQLLERGLTQFVKMATVFRTIRIR